MNWLPSAKILLAAGIVFVIAAAGVFGYWANSGSHFVTQYQVEHTVVEEDEFGDEIETTEWRDEFQFGLMPDADENPVTGAAVLGGVPGGLGVVLLILAAVKAKFGDD